MNVIIKTTNQCNFACSYCSVGQPDRPVTLDLATFCRFVDGIPKLLDECGDKYIDFIWHGGEPLLLPINFYLEAMEYAKDKLEDYKVSFKIQTNGFLIDAEWISLFKTYEVAVGISLDGPAHLHDASRRTHGGAATHDKIMANISAINAAGINVGVLSVINSLENVDAAELVSFYAENKLSCKLQPVYPCGRAAERTGITDFYKAYTNFTKEIYRHMIAADIEIEPFSQLTQAIINDTPVRDCAFSGQCGHGFICLDGDGIVSACGRHSDSASLQYGSIAEASVFDLYHSSAAEAVRARIPTLQEGPCADCFAFEFCHGGCSFEAYLSAGHINAISPQCEHWRDLISFIYDEGLDFIKRKIVFEKKARRTNLATNKALLEEVEHENT